MTISDESTLRLNCDLGETDKITKDSIEYSVMPHIVWLILRVAFMLVTIKSCELV